MDSIVIILLALGVTYIMYILHRYLVKIVKHLRVIRLQLEIQNPMFVSEELLALDRNINYWREKALEYKDDISDENKEIRDLTHGLFFGYVERLNRFRIMIAEADKTGNPTKVHEKYEDWLDENEEKMENMETKAMELDERIKKDITSKRLDLEFLGYWRYDEL